MTTRPTTLKEYIGQTNLKKELRLKIDSAISRGVRLDHVLLVGVPGVGKTTLGQIIANEMFEEFESFIMPIDTKTLQALMYEYSGVVLLDEIHRVTRGQQELLLPILEDGYMQTKTGQRIENNEITFVAATTRGDEIDPAVRDRFRIKPLFDPYTDSEMAQIIVRMATNENIELSGGLAADLAKATLGAPRNAETIVDTIRDLKLRNSKMPSKEQILSCLRLTDTGLGAEHVRYCELLASAGGQAGLPLIKSLLAMPAGSIEQLEIDLIKQGFVQRTSSGRLLSQRGFQLAGFSRFGKKKKSSNA